MATPGDTGENLYDIVAYPGHALAQAHPDRLATLATLFGISPPSVHSARVLEVGCGDGLNLISIAQGLPGAECVGIDLAAAGLQKGQAVVDRLGLRNVSLRQCDICETGTELGQFDYIIAHGLYSWVPLKVRDRLLEICRGNLAGNGVAYVSYNTYPGCHLRQMVRAMMTFHVQHMDSPAEKVGQGRALLRFLGQHGSLDPEFYRPILEREFSRLTDCLDSSVFHDDLADVNTPVYFHEFVEHASRHGLQYLAEAQFFEMQSGIFPPEAVQILNKISDSRVSKEQYMDFLKCRSFRQTLLVRAEQELNLAVSPERITSLYVASPLGAESTATELTSSEPVTFLGPKKSSLTTDNPLIKAAFVCLGELWPQAVKFRELLARARELLQSRTASAGDTDIDAQTLAETLLRAYAGGLIELSVCPPRLVTKPGEHPIASALARMQAEEGFRITNLRHHNLELQDQFCLELLKLLDGTRDRERLTEELNAQAQSKRVLPPGVAEHAKPLEIREAVSGWLDPNLQALAGMALLVA